MSFKQILEQDLEVFYNTSEFAQTAFYENEEVAILFQDDIEIEDSSKKLIKVQAKDFSSNINEGQNLIINNENFEILNFDFVDSSKLEYLVVLKEI